MEGEDVEVSSYAEDLWLEEAAREGEETPQVSKREKKEEEDPAKEEEEEGRTEFLREASLNQAEEVAFSAWISGNQRVHGCFRNICFPRILVYRCE